MEVSKAVFLATGRGVGSLNGACFLDNFASGSFLHQTSFTLGKVHNRLVPLYVEMSDGSCHFADAKSLVESCPGLEVLRQPEGPYSSISFCISLNTRVELIAPEHSFVVCVSVRASCATLDPYTGDVVADRNYMAVEAVVGALHRAYDFPWRDKNFSLLIRPTVRLTVVAEAGTGWETCRTLSHGVMITSTTDIEPLMSHLKFSLLDFERVAQQRSGGEQQQCGELGYGLRTAAFMMGLMPSSLRRTIVMIADGVATSPDLLVYDSPLMMLQRQGITCHVVQTGAFQPFQPLGCIPSCESLQQLAMSSGGYYFDYSSNSELYNLYRTNPDELYSILAHSMLSVDWCANSSLEDALLLPRASYAPYLKHHYLDQRNVLFEVFLEPTDELHDVLVICEPFPWDGQAPRVPILRQLVREYHLSSDCWTLTSARVQEGFRFLSLEPTSTIDGACDFTLSLWMAWMPNVKIVYAISSTVDVGEPNSAMQRPSSVSIYVYAHYEFLLRLSQAKESKTSQKRISPGIEAFLKFVKRIVRTDRVFNHLAVNSSAVLSTCDPVSGALPPQHQDAFWQIVGSLGNKPWQRWFLLRHMIFMLRPDKGDVNSLVSASDDISFSMARTSLFSLCKEWSAFSVSTRESVPIYCRLVAPASDGRPTGFCLLRPMFSTRSLAVLQFAVFGASQLHMDQEVENFMARLTGRGKLAPLSAAFYPALLTANDTETEEMASHLAVQSMLPSSSLFGGPAAPRLSALQWYRSWKWTLLDAALRARLLGLLRRHRVFDRFFVLSWPSGTFVTELSLSPSRRACFQCRLVESGDMLLMETWMEPLWPDGASAFEKVCAHLQKNDERIVTEIFTWRFVSDMLETNMSVPNLNNPAVKPVAQELPPGSPSVSASELVRNARATYRAQLTIPPYVQDQNALFSLLCRSVAMMSGCMIPENNGSIASSFATFSIRKDLMFTRVLKDGNQFVVEISDVRYSRLGRPQLSDDPETVRLLGADAPDAVAPVAALAAPTSGSNKQRSQNHHAMAICSIAPHLHRRNVIRCVYHSLRKSQPVDATVFDEIFPTCIEADLDVDLSEFLHVISEVSFSQQQVAKLREKFVKALADVNFAPIPQVKAFVYTGSGQQPQHQPQPQQQPQPAVSDAVSAPLPFSAPPPAVDAIWDEDTLLTLRELRTFNVEEAYPFFVRLSVEAVDHSNKNLPPHVLSKEYVTSLPCAALSSDAKVSSLMRLTCLTLPPYRSRAGDAVFNAKSKRFPDPPEDSHSPFRTKRVAELPPVLSSGMMRLRERVDQLICAEIVDLLRYVPLEDTRKDLLVRSMRKMQPQPQLLRERWAPRFCRDSGPILMKKLLPSVALQTMGMRELKAGGALTVWFDAEDIRNMPLKADGSLVDHWLLLEPEQDGGLQVLLFVSAIMPDEECRDLIRGANERLWEPLLRKVNQLSLLKELHDTRACPALLEAPGPSDPPVALQSSRDARFGAVGSLACPIQQPSVSIKMHPRVAWDQARRAVYRSLQLFAVEDRAGLFVYQHPATEEIWYFRVKYEEGALLLNFHGLSSPPESLLQDVTKLINATLAQATVSAMAQDALRAPVFKVSQQDFWFMKPSDVVPYRAFLKLPVVARCSLRKNWWALFREVAGSFLHAIWLDGHESQSPTFFVHVPSPDGIALIFLRCCGTSEAYGNEASKVEEFLSPMNGWQERTSHDFDEDAFFDSKVDEDSHADFGVFATVWCRGQAQASAILESLSVFLGTARASLGLDLALSSLPLDQSDSWGATQFSQVWTLLERSTTSKTALAFRLKGLGLISTHITPLANNISGAIAQEHTKIYVRKNPESSLERGPLPGLEAPRAKLVVIGRSRIVSEHCIIVAIITKDMVEVRAHGFPEALVQSVREACTQYLSWAGLRNHIMNATLFAKMGLPYPRDFQQRKAVRLSESLLESAAVSTAPPGNTSNNSRNNSGANIPTKGGGSMRPLVPQGSFRSLAQMSSEHAVSMSTLSLSQSVVIPTDPAQVIISPQLKSAIPLCLAPNAPKTAFAGRVPTTDIVTSDVTADPVTRHTLHLLAEVAAVTARSNASASGAHPVRIIAACSSDLFGAEGSKPNVLSAGESEPFYSYPRATTARLDGHLAWLRKHSLREFKTLVQSWGFHVLLENAEQCNAQRIVKGRGRVDVLVAFKQRYTMMGRAYVTTEKVPADKKSAASVVDFAEVIGKAEMASSVRALAVDTACSALAAVARGAAEAHECWVRSVLRGACEAVGIPGNKCFISSVDVTLAFPSSSAAVDSNAFEVMRYLTSHATDYQLSNMAMYGVEPVLCVSLEAPAFMVRSGCTVTKSWGLAEDVDVSQEQWTFVALYLHTRGEGGGDKRRMKLRILLARAPAASSSKAVERQLNSPDPAALLGIIGNPVRRVLSDFARDQAWRSLHSSNTVVDVAQVVGQCAILPAPPSVPHLTSTLRGSSVPSWDSMLSHLNRWRPNLLRPYTVGNAKYVLILQHPVGVNGGVGASGSVGSVKAMSVARDDGGASLLPELERIQTGSGGVLPDYAVLLSREDMSVPMTCSLVRRRQEDAGAPFSEAELSELDAVIRTLAIWLWMLARKE